MRKFIVITLIIVLIVAIGIGVYFGYQKAKTRISPIPSTQKTLPISGGGKVTSQEQKEVGAEDEYKKQELQEDEVYFQDQKRRLSIMSTQPAVGYWITIPQNASSSSEIFYINQKGEVIQITEPAKEKVVASSNFGVPLRVLQNIDGSRVIVFFDSGKKAIFNTASKVWQEIDSEITSVTFSPDGNSIAFLKSNGSQTSIYIQNVSTSKKSVTLVANLSILDFSILWPSSNQLVLVSKPSNKFLGEAWYLNLKTKTLNFLHSGKGLDLVYSLKSNYGLKFSAADRTRTDVSIVDKNGNKLADMPFSSIGVKCAFAQLEPLAYCAIPLRFSIDQPLMPDDYFKKAVFTNDTIYKIDLASSIVTKVIDDQTAPIDGVDLRASSSTLYFINRLDGLLYSFSL